MFLISRSPLFARSCSGAKRACCVWACMFILFFLMPSFKFWVSI